jgi:hypothetical protein
MKSYKPFAEVMLVLGFQKLHQDFTGSVDFTRAFLSESTGESCPRDFEALSNHCDVKDALKEQVSILGGAQSLVDTDPEIQRLRTEQSTLERQQRDTESAKSSALSSLQEIDKFSNYLEFIALKDQCFDVIDGKFSYSLCVMSSVKQKEVDGHNTVTLGNFESFVEYQDNDYTLKMQFTNGQYCHAFGARRADVTVVCGEKNALKSASEPSTCTYALLFESPAACNTKYAQAYGIQ